MRRHRPLLSALALVATLAGCSRTPADTATSSADDPAVTRTAQGVKFSACMRANGIKDFPDPDASGELSIDGIANDSKVDVNSAAFETALNACNDLQPAGFTGDKRTAAQQSEGLEFAKCIRDHGVTDFPDPDPNGPLIDTNRIPSTDTKGGMSTLNAAIEQCRDLGPDGAKSR